MGNILKVGVSWTPQGIDRKLKTSFKVGVGGLPTRIEVTKNPNKMDYAVGDTFNPAGIIVHAYYENGDDYGTVLNSELTYDPMEIAASSEYSDGDGVNALKIVYNTQTSDNRWVYGGYLGYSEVYNEYYSLGGDRPAELLLTRYNNRLYAARLNGCSEFSLFSFYNGLWNFSGGTTYRTSYNVFEHAVWDDEITDVPTSTKNPTTASSLQPVGCKITVKWNRPVDGQTLSTTINVNII